MKLFGIGLMVVGALTMLAAFFYSPYIHYSHWDRTKMALERTEAEQFMGKGPQYSAEDFPASVYSADRAQRRELGFMGGGVALIAGVILFAAGSFRRTSET